MKKIGPFIFFITNLYLAYMYLADIYKYSSREFNYDGWRYLPPLIVAECSFFIGLLFITIAFGIKKRFFLYLVSALLSNLAVGFRVENMRFIGLLFSITTLCFIIKYEFLNKQA